MPHRGQLGLQLVEGRQHVRPARRGVHILRHRRGEARHPQHRGGGVDRLPRPGDQADGGQPVLQPGRGGGPAGTAEHLGADRRGARAERRQVQVLEHQIDQAPIGRRVPFDGADQRVRGLVRGAGIDAQGQAGGVQQLAVRPDAPHPVRRTLPQPHGEGQAVGVAIAGPAGSGQGAGLAAAAGGVHPPLPEPCGPEDLAPQPHPAKARGQGLALRRGVQLQAGEPAPHRLARQQHRGRRPVDLAAQRPADQPAHRAGDGAADGGEDHLRHGRGSG